MGAFDYKPRLRDSASPISRSMGSEARKLKSVNISTVSYLASVSILVKVVKLHGPLSVNHSVTEYYSHSV